MPRRNPPDDWFMVLLPYLIAGGVLFFFRDKIKTLLPANNLPFTVLKSSDTTIRKEKTVSDAIQKAFTAAMMKYAPAIEKRYGIKTIILVSQSSLESTYGTSGLAQQGRNLFGIKQSTQWELDGKPVWQGQTQEFINGKYILGVDKFKKYNTWEESIYDWAELISQKYKTAYFYAKNGDVKGFGNAIVSTGYATQPNYATLLTEVASRLA